jgi:hypothetical protein
MSMDESPLALPAYVDWPLFPFEGELRVKSPTRDEPPSVPVLVILETRVHVDLDGLDGELAAELGQMIVRLDRAIRSVGNVGRVHVHRWGDGAEHFHLWFFARPVGSMNMLGFGAMVS